MSARMPAPLQARTHHDLMAAHILPGLAAGHVGGQRRVECMGAVLHAFVATGLLGPKGPGRDVLAPQRRVVYPCGVVLVTTDASPRPLSSRSGLLDGCSDGASLARFTLFHGFAHITAVFC
jgi:hypothetical protein